MIQANNIKKITKLAIFVDFDNFSITHGKRFCNIPDYKERGKEGEYIWKTTVFENICEQFTAHYQDKFIKNNFEIVDHIGTYVCIGVSENPDSEELHYRSKFRLLDRKNGFIVKYGSRNLEGKEKGVDSEIICHMLMGAFLNQYDACFLFSDDADYIPAIKRIQDYFGKKVIHAGYASGKVRESTFGHIALEKLDENLQKPENS